MSKNYDNGPPCPRCGSQLVFMEHLPTDEYGTYRWACGSDRDDNGEYVSDRCKANSPATKDKVTT